MTARPVALALRALGLGDFVTGLPALGLLRAALPDHRVVLAAPAVFAPLIPLIPAVDELLPAAELAAVRPRPDGLDVAIDLHGNGPASRRLLAELRPPRLYGFDDPAGTLTGSLTGPQTGLLTGPLTGPQWRAGEHEVARWCRLVREALPVELAGAAASTGEVLPAGEPRAVDCLRLPDLPGPVGVTVVHPGAAAESRRWPADRFAAVAIALRRQGHSVVVTGGPAERELVRAVAGRAGVPALTELTLLELVALIGRARLVICGDTGVAHLASNYRTPSVLLFGPVSPAVWGPPPGPHRVLWHGDGTGDPHGQQVDPALRAITVEEVLTAAGGLAEVGAALPG